MKCPKCHKEIDESNCATGYRHDKGQGYICPDCKVILWQEEEDEDDG